MTIDTYAFGKIRIDGRTCDSDVVIWPDHVTCPWWRAEGHVLAPGDLGEVLAAPPKMLVIGTGYYGRMAVPQETRAALQLRGIQLHISRTPEAVDEFNRLARRGADVVAALHLSC